MDNILRRPMFRGGRVENRGGGITSLLGYAIIYFLQKLVKQEQLKIESLVKDLLVFYKEYMIH
jgi:hypothetical protein